jgi:hypothetical protein
MAHSTYIFARSSSDYVRFGEQQSAVGPSSLGIYPRKEQGRLGIGMIRGGGRLAQRSAGSRAHIGDQGPIRFELRIPCPGAAGHPNKSAYPSQRALPYEMIEAYTHILANGAAEWRGRELMRRQGVNPEKITENLLETYPEKLPQSLSESLEGFLINPCAKTYWGKRVEILQALTHEMDALHNVDRSPYALVKGPHVPRGALRDQIMNLRTAAPAF